MLCMFGRGHLGMDPELKVTNATGKYYRVRIGVSRFVAKQGGEGAKESLWCSGLIHEDKIKFSLENMKKGSSVTFMSNKGWIRQWDDKGSSGAEIDLGFLAMLEVGGKLPPREQNGAQAAPPPFNQPQTPPPPPQPVWDGEKWVMKKAETPNHPF